MHKYIYATRPEDIGEIIAEDDVFSVVLVNGRVVVILTKLTSDTYCIMKPEFIIDGSRTKIGKLLISSGIIDEKEDIGRIVWIEEYINE